MANEKIRTNEVERLLKVLSGIDDPDVMFAFLQDLCTVREIQEISQRLQVARLLDEGVSYLAIQESTGASATTISRVSKALNYGADGYRHALEMLAED